MAIAHTAAQESVGHVVSIPGKRNATGGRKIRWRHGFSALL